MNVRVKTVPSVGTTIDATSRRLGLEKPEPGILQWRTPSGRTYTTTPTEYPI